MFRRNKPGKKGARKKSLGSGKTLHIEGLVSVPQAFSGVPRALRITLRYVEQWVLGSNAGYVTIRGNDLFDPFATSSGVSGANNAQPAYFDKWASLFNHYTVIGSKFTVRCCNGNTNANPTMISVSPEDELFTSTNGYQSATAPFAKNKILSNGPSTPEVTIKHEMTTARINGASLQKILDEPNYSASVTGTPADPWYWQFRYSSGDQTNSVGVFAWAVIEYDALFTDPVQDSNDDFFLRTGIRKPVAPAGKDEAKGDIHNSMDVDHGHAEHDEEYTYDVVANSAIPSPLTAGKAARSVAINTGIGRQYTTTPPTLMNGLKIAAKAATR
jgi:hypothetical protein